MENGKQPVPKPDTSGGQPNPGDRKRRVLNHGHSSMTRSVSDAQVIKDGAVFFLCEPDGQVAVGGEHGLGLYYHDCRFLNGYELRCGRVALDTLASTAVSGFTAAIELTNTDIHEKEHLIEKQQVGIRWERTVDSDRCLLQDSITLHNYGMAPVDMPLSLVFSSGFESIFMVRGLVPEKRGTLREPWWEDARLRFEYDGADDIRRMVRIEFSPRPQATGNDSERRDSRHDPPASRPSAHFSFHVEGGKSSTLRVTVAIAETKAEQTVAWPPALDARRARVTKLKAADESLGNQARVVTESRVLQNVMDRSLRDLHMLENERSGQRYYSAGVPWYVALFGRDSLISALQMLAYKPDIAAHTLRLLAALQGTRQDKWRDEDPGKIMHELRVGELAHLNEIPQTPYYGSVDSTPLFLIVLAQHAAWTGSLALFHELRPHVEAALNWMDTYGDSDGDGFLDYASGSSKGLSNQGWKDSGDAIMNEDGSLCRPPIALVEVQGYAYMARRGIADLYRRSGNGDRGKALEEQAEQLRQRFNDAYWLNDRRCYALALQKGGRPAAVVASNPGQALWTGIVDPDKAQDTVRALLGDDMYSGWGIRTLSGSERRYNPIGYHLGTVWPHDNALIAAGFRRYGFSGEACRVFSGIVEAAMHFPHHRLPEVFAGFARPEFPNPVRYPVACHPQAWAAGSVPLLLTVLLGLSPDAFEGRLEVAEPVLPEFVRWVELRGLRVGTARVDLRFERAANGSATVDVLKTEGTLRVEVFSHGREHARNTG